MMFTALSVYHPLVSNQDVSTAAAACKALMHLFIHSALLEKRLGASQQHEVQQLLPQPSRGPIGSVSDISILLPPKSSTEKIMCAADHHVCRQRSGGHANILHTCALSQSSHAAAS